MIGTDDIDRAYIASLIPERAIATGMVTVITWLDPETGAEQWRVWCDADNPASSVLGHLELAKADIMKRTWGGLPCSVDYSRDEDDDDAAEA